MNRQTHVLKTCVNSKKLIIREVLARKNLKNCVGTLCVACHTVSQKFNFKFPPCANQDLLALIQISVSVFMTKKELGIFFLILEFFRFSVHPVHLHFFFCGVV